MAFSHLHVHTQFSLLDGAASIPALFKKAAADGQPAVAITDHGNKLPAPDSGWIDFAIYTRPGPDGTGRIEIFANDKWVVTVTGMIGHGDRGLGQNQYFKFGPYRAGAAGTWALYYDDFRRSPDCVITAELCPAP